MIGRIFGIIFAVLAWLFTMEAPIYIIKHIWEYNPYSYLHNVVIGYISSAFGAFFAATVGDKLAHLTETVVIIFVSIFAVVWLGNKLMNASPELFLFKAAYLAAALFAIISFHIYNKLHNT